jgi:hypothetical protein
MVPHGRLWIGADGFNRSLAVFSIRRATPDNASQLEQFIWASYALTVSLIWPCTGGSSTVGLSARLLRWACRRSSSAARTLTAATSAAVCALMAAAVRRLPVVGASRVRAPSRSAICFAESATAFTHSAACTRARLALHRPYTLWARCHRALVTPPCPQHTFSHLD